MFVFCAVNQVYELWDFDQDYPDSAEDEEMCEEDNSFTQQPLIGTCSVQTGRLPPASQAIDVIMLDRD